MRRLLARCTELSHPWALTKHLSNQLRTLDEFLFSELQVLEVLLLYNNHIMAVDRCAFDDMTQLQKLYLSQNQISRFPLELVKEGATIPVSYLESHDALPLATRMET